MYDLHILDVSALLHFGMNSEFYKDRVSYTYNVGGIHKVMRHIMTAFFNNDEVVLAFDSRNNFRKQLMPSYKAGRVSNKYVISQNELLLEELPRIGFHCYQFDGYEGDDIINWAVNDLHSSGYGKILIIGNDNDLAHNVRNDVVFHSINDNVNSVTENNFAFALSRNESVPFNFISVKKVLTGCKSDKVAPFISEKGITGTELFDAYLKALESANVPFVYNNTTSSKLFMMFMKACSDLTDKDLQELELRCKIIFPAQKPSDVSIVADRYRKLDRDLLIDFLSFVNDYDSLKRIPASKHALRENQKKELSDRNKALTSGTFAVDRNFPVNESYEDSVLTLKEF
jgi:hypothetical protein